MTPQINQKKRTIPSPSTKGASLTILVTGGAGFLGSHLSERMIAQGHDVYCLDNFSTGNKSNVARLTSSERFHVVGHDVVDPLPADLPRFDEIYNLACPASPIHYQADRVKTALTSALGTWNVIQKADRDNSRLFHASTSEIYGDPDVHPQRETYNGNVNPIGPRSCYDEGKRFAETLLTDYAAANGRIVRIARIFNTYGPRMRADDGRVVSNFVVQALRGEDLTIYGDGSQTRSFCYVDDLIAGFEALMRSPAKIDAPVNLGNPNEITVVELARDIIQMTRSMSRVISLPLPIDDPRRRRPDISRARDLLSWAPKVDLRDGLRKTIRYFDQGLPAPSAESTNIQQAYTA